LIPLVDLKIQYQTIKTKIDMAIANVIEDSAFIGGKYVQAFEEAFKSYVGVSYCIGCANGTDALEISLKALGIGSGDEVIVPAHTWISTAESVTTIGAKPIFVDTISNLYTINVNHIEAKITPKTRAIIPVHLYGLPADIDVIMEIAKKHNLKVIEDCAQAHGSKYKGQNVGTFGDAATFSFFPGKNLGAYGDAGAIVTNNEDIATLARMIANHGRLDKYDHYLEGRNSRLDGLQAAILSVKLPYLNTWTELRRQHAEIYNQYLGSSSLVIPKEPEYAYHVYHLYVIQTENRTEVQQRLKLSNILTGIHYPIALPMLKAYQYIGASDVDFPISISNSHKILSLPMYPELTKEQIEFICSVLLSIS